MKAPYWSLATIRWGTNGKRTALLNHWKLNAAGLALAVLLAAGGSARAAQTDLAGPADSVQFGTAVAVLPNGNFVVTDPSYSTGAANVGAVYLYDGATLAVISKLTGSTANDKVGSGGVTVLANGNYVVNSFNWANPGAANAGAVTWGSMTAGVSGVVSDANSLVGSTANDQIGSYYGENNLVTALPNGNYVVRSPDWDNGGAADAGAVTWGSGTAGVSGVVSAANSLVGSTANDQVGSTSYSYNFVTALANGNYVVGSPNWDGAVVNAGAVTWGSGTLGVKGAVSTANSLFGTKNDDRVGSGGVTALANGNYVVGSPEWKNDSAASAGAVTWGSGTAVMSAEVSTANSLVGSTAYDQVGNSGVTALANGNYVVCSSSWINSGTYVGAVTWGNGSAMMSAVVSSGNSLVGSTAYDNVGSAGATALSNGNYVVNSPNWRNVPDSAASAGAVTWGSGTAVMSAVVSKANSLFGTKNSDSVGSGGVTALANGNYVVRSPAWDNGGAADAGAVTWLSGTVGEGRDVNNYSSLAGSTTSDRVGSGGVTALANGNYVVRSPDWGSGTWGAVTWGSGTAGVSGTISSANSLVGGGSSDQIGNGGVTALSNGNYAVISRGWYNGDNRGAVTWGDCTSGTVGTIAADNSVVGNSLGGATIVSAFDSLNNRLVVGYPAGNRVSLLKARQPLTWAAGSHIWEINATANWKDSWGNNTVYREPAPPGPGDAVVFDDTPGDTGPYTVILRNNVAPISMTVSNATKDYTVSWESGTGGIAGSGSLTKQGAGTLRLASANTYTGNTTVSAGKLLVNGSLASGSAVTVASAGTLGGTGTAAGAVTVNGTIAPGASVGTLNTGPQTWAPGGLYEWQINDATGTAGSNPGWDWLNTTGTLTVTATSGSKFTIKVVSLSGSAAGTCAAFSNQQAYSWRIATASGGVSGFSADKFTLNTNGFANSLEAANAFSIVQTGNDIYLNFTPGRASTTTGIASDLNPSTYGTVVTFTATVTGAGGTPSGTVQFQTNGVNFGSAVTLASGGPVLK